MKHGCALVRRDMPGAARSSERLVRERDSAGVIVLTVSKYNFSVPPALKDRIDMICRAGLTFNYTENGTQGLLKNRPVYLVMASASENAELDILKNNAG